MKKVIFLDIDGVLVTHRWWSLRHSVSSIIEKGEFDPVVQSDFENWLLKHPDVNIVLSSSWRLLDNNPYSIPFGWASRIGKESPFIVSRIIGITPILDKPRGEEIKAWMNNHGSDLTHYVIIDDDSDMLEDQKPNFVKTGFAYGLTRTLLKKVNSILGE